MTKDWLEELRARCEAATPGPWETDDEDNGIAGPNGGLVAFVHPYANTHTVIASGEEWSHADAAFIAAARTDLPRALAVIEKADAVFEAMDDVEVPWPVLKALAAYRKARHG